MAYQDVKLPIANYLNAQYGDYEVLIANSVTYVLKVENFNYNAPPGMPWLRWGIQPTDQRAIECEGQLKRNIGHIWFQIMLPEDTGQTIALLIGDELTAKFAEKYIGTIKTFSANLSRSGPDGTGWDIWNVLIPYQYDAV